MAYLTVLAMYLPVSILGFLAFGDDVQTNILSNLSSTSGITKSVAALIAAHLLFSFIIVVNPVSQQLEEWLNVPKGWLLIVVKGSYALNIATVTIQSQSSDLNVLFVFLMARFIKDRFIKDGSSVWTSLGEKKIVTSRQTTQIVRLIRNYLFFAQVRPDG